MQDFALVDQSAVDMLACIDDMEEEAFAALGSGANALTFTTALSDGTLRPLKGDGTDVVTFDNRQEFTALTRYVCNYTCALWSSFSLQSPWTSLSYLPNMTF